MLKFLKYVLATIVGLFLFSFLFILLIVGIAASAGSESVVEVSPNSVLKLDLSYNIPDKTSSNPFLNISPTNLKPQKQLGLNDLVKVIEAAKVDKNIKGIYLDLGINMSGYATLDVVRNKLIDFKKSGKFVYAYGSTVSQKAYYLGSVADKIVLNPSGGMEMSGFGREITYFKGALDKLGIEVQEFHCGQFKSAIEPFTKDKMSDQNRAQLTSIYGEIYQHFLKNIATSRKIEMSTLDNAINDLKAFLPEDCKELKLVDELGYYDAIESSLRTKLGIKTDDKIQFVEAVKYVTSIDQPEIKTDKLAVIYAEGEIVDGKGEEGQIGGDEFAKMIKKAREDKNIKALVLRVNSPGGSALASDIMWREIVLARKEKPVVVSFGNVSASGGYFISCNSDRIFAEPTTITGSIGIFGLIPNAKKLLNEKLGITTDQVEVTKHGAFNMVTNPFDTEERALIQRTIEKGYREFKQRVADGRGKDTAYVETVAQGKVFTGTQALSLGLVDELGGLENAIAYAAKKANLKEYSIKEYPQEKDFATQISEAFGEAKANTIKEESGVHYEIYKTLKTLQKGSGIQMRLPYELGL